MFLHIFSEFHCFDIDRKNTVYWASIYIDVLFILTKKCVEPKLSSFLTSLHYIRKWIWVRRILLSMNDNNSKKMWKFKINIHRIFHFTYLENTVWCVITTLTCKQINANTRKRVQNHEFYSFIHREEKGKNRKKTFKSNPGNWGRSSNNK